MAEVIRPTMERAATTYTEKHTIGVEKARRTDSWKVGIFAREKKVERVSMSANISREIQDRAIRYAEEKGIPYLPGVNGLAFEIVRLKYLGYTDQINKIIESVPDEWKDYLKQVAADANLLSSYKQLRSVRV